MNELDYHVPPHLKPCIGNLSALLASFLTFERINKLQTVVETRSRHVLTVFEATHHCHNISAVLRTIDFLGFQDIFFLYPKLPKVRYKDSVERGSAEWLTLRSTDSISCCINKIKDADYKIILVSSPLFETSSVHHEHRLPNFQAPELGNKNFWSWTNEKKLAIIFGNEATGLSKAWHEAADGYVFISQNGFAESLNLSVCAGIILHSLRNALDNKDVFTKSALVDMDTTKLLLDFWTIKSMPAARKIINASSPYLKEYFEYIINGDFFRPF